MSTRTRQLRKPKTKFMTIVEYFDPNNVEHLKAFRLAVDEVELQSLPVDYLQVHFSTACGIDENEYDWPNDWGQLIIAKMADAWLEDRIPK